jgi:hypothetical protein
MYKIHFNIISTFTLRYTKCLEGLKERNHLEDRGIDGRMGLEWILREIGWGRLWSGFTWLRIGTGGGLW